MAILKASSFVPFDYLHLQPYVVHIKIRSESVSNTVDGVLNHQFILLGYVLLLVISGDRSAHVILHHVHQVRLLAVGTSFPHLQCSQWPKLPSPFSVPVLNIGDVLSHLASFPVSPRGTLPLLLDHGSNMGHVPDCSILIVLQSLLELMYKLFMVDDCY
jgi:hypothetical protein